MSDALNNPEVLKLMIAHNIKADDPLFVFLAAEHDILLQLESVLEKTKTDSAEMTLKANETVQGIIRDTMNHLQRVDKTYAEFDAIMKRFETLSDTTYALFPQIRENTDRLAADIEEKIRSINTDTLIETIESTIREKASRIPATELHESVERLQETQAVLAGSVSAVTSLTRSLTIKAVLVLLGIGLIIGVLAGFSIGLSSYVRQADAVTENSVALKKITETGAVITAGKDAKGYYLTIDAPNYEAKKIDGKAVLYFK